MHGCYTLVWSCWGEVWLSRGVLWLRVKVRCYLESFSLAWFKILTWLMVSLVPHFKNWHIFVGMFECMPGFSSSLQSLAKTFHSLPMARDPISVPWTWQSQWQYKRVGLQCPQPCLPMSPAECRCHHRGLSFSLQAGQLPAAVLGWALGRTVPGWQAHWLLCRVCASCLMCLMTRPNFCESAQEFHSWSYPDYIILFCVCFCMCIYIKCTAF